MPLYTRIGAVVDRLALGIMRRAFLTTSRGYRLPNDITSRVRAMRDFYAREDWIADPNLFFVPPQGAPRVQQQKRGRIAQGESIDLAFPSRYRPHNPAMRDLFFGYHENETARARYLRGSAGRPTIIFLHGWGGGNLALEWHLFRARSFFKLGLDAVVFQLPFHGRRRPARARFSGQLFPSAHIGRTAEAFGQTIHDLRSLILWLRERGSPAVGVCGMSLGGYITALLASLDSLDFAVPMIPISDLAGLLWSHGSERGTLRRAEHAGITLDDYRAAWRVVSPLARPCQTAFERRLIIAGRGDQITPAAQAEALWEHWQRCRIHWFSGGHLAQFGRSGGWQMIRQLLAEIGVT
jgi:pimeloyl-ACP methyl ester carboxylesterase